jgi:hypothetical protein
MTATGESDQRVWDWHVKGSFNPHYDVTATREGLSYYCEIQGPFCGYDAVGKQSWDEFLSAGPLRQVQMPSSIEAEVRAYAKTLTGSPRS